LDQKIHTAIQKKGLMKLLGLRYKILMRRTAWYEDVYASYEKDCKL
jgi:hypothetical protein